MDPKPRRAAAAWRLPHRLAPARRA
jgi:hypothetical protein